MISMHVLVPSKILFKVLYDSLTIVILVVWHKNSTGGPYITSPVSLRAILMANGFIVYSTLYSGSLAISSGRVGISTGTSNRPLFGS